MRNLTRRTALIGIGGLAGWTASKTITPRLPTLEGNTLQSPQFSGTVLNDASGLSPTPVHRHIIVKEDPGQTLIAAIRAEMTAARSEGRGFCIGAARHSMGGQAIPRDGYAVTFENATVEPDTGAGTYLTHAGTRWADVIRALDPIGWSPKVMQSNNDFGVAATFSVNAHGWPVPFGPMGSTVRSLRMVLADGSLVTCSPSENSELFFAAMGGYGLIGAIVDMVVEMEPNRRLMPEVQIMPATDFAAAMQAAVTDAGITMAYGRLNVERASFFTEAVLVTWRETVDQTDLPAASGSGWTSHVASRIYRAQLGNERMKSFRWWNETRVGPRVGAGEATRNSLINEPVATLADRDENRTDILHEYFVGLDRFNDFLSICQNVIPNSYQEFLNVTLRYVAADTDSLLSFATVPRIAAVMSFSQELTSRAEADMQRLTRELIDQITAIGGTYYLPYRPHARRDQFTKAYEGAGRFAAFKRQIDPGLVLRNNLWDRYLDQL